MPPAGATLAIGGLLTCGTVTSLLAKIVYELEGVGRDGKNRLFTKPWAMTTLMFVGMSLCLPLAYWQQFQARKKRDTHEAAQALLGELPQGKQRHSEMKEIFLLTIPTIFDLIATVLMNVGLLSVTASVYQMMRGAEMLFAALFSVLFLHRTLNKFHMGGILCCVVGISLVGAASLLAGEGSATHHISQWQMFVGMSLIVLSQAVQAAQITFEDFFLSNMDIAAMKIVGFEGVWGAAAMILVLLPVVQHVPGEEGSGLHEDSIDSLHMIFHSKTIATVLLVDMAALLFYNLSGMAVTGHLGAVFRTVLETTRTLFVWLVGLLLFYTPLGFGKLGESWSRWSLVQAAGFLVLVAGTLIYGRGDEVEEKQVMEELGLDAADAEEAALAVSREVPRRTSSTAGVPFGRTASSVTRPMMMGTTPASYKSTMNINAVGSYRGSYMGSYMHDQHFGGRASAADE